MSGTVHNGSYVTVVRAGRGIERTLDRAIAMTGQQVLVGIPRGTDDRGQSHARTGNPIGNAGIGYINEFGSPAQRIPPRPWLTTGVRETLPQVQSYVQSCARAMASPNATAADATALLHRIGSILRSGVRAKVVRGPFTPLAPKTLRMRRLRGFYGTSPLIETGAFVGSINYVLRRV